MLTSPFIRSTSLLSLIVVSTATYAQFTGNIGVTTAAVVPTSVPTIPASMLVVLSLLIGTIVARTLKKGTSTKVLSMLAVSTVVFLGSLGSIKLINDAAAFVATYTVNLNPNNGTVSIAFNGNGIYKFINATAAAHTITAVDTSAVLPFAGGGCTVNLTPTETTCEIGSSIPAGGSCKVTIIGCTPP